MMTPTACRSGKDLASLMLATMTICAVLVISACFNVWLSDKQIEKNEAKGWNEAVMSAKYAGVARITGETEDGRYVVLWVRRSILPPKNSNGDGNKPD